MTQPGAPPRAMVLQDAQIPYDPVVFIRGNPNREGDPVPRGFLRAVAGDTAAFSRGSGRRDLAEAIASPKNPLTARVIVNRVWGWHFGRGLVATPSDFGLRGEVPTHPALLDWLARDFMENDWSLKHLHRRIMNSSAYGQASARDDAAAVAAVDPENRLLWHFPRRRLDFESTRDAMLAASGALDRTIGGAPIDLLKGFQPRRTLYGFIDRMDLPNLMRSFDFPDPAATSPQREQTTIAPQALFFMNDPFGFACAQRLMKRDDVAGRKEPDEQIRRIYEILFGREPDSFELAAALRFVEGNAETSVTESHSQDWQYGYGAIDEDSQRVSSFQTLAHWTGERWQGGPKLPDPKLGWVFMDRRGGHPAATLDRCAIRRWTAPAAGRYEIAGELIHVPEQGDGVRGRIASSSTGILGEWTADQSRAAVEPLEVMLARGDTLDFVVDFRETILHDEHEWPVTIRRIGSSVESREWNSERDFRGEQTDRWTELVHALMMTNEFVFVD